MAQHSQFPFTILRRPQVEAICGYSRSTLYNRIRDGLWPTAVKIGPRSVGWLASEAEALNAARIAGQTDDAIKDLVRKLEEQRKAAASRMLATEATEAA